MSLFPWNSKIVILGAGDRGTAAALRVFHSGFQPIIIERAQPNDLHFMRNFSDVIYCQRKTIENVQAAAVLPESNAQLLDAQVLECLNDRIIPVINNQSYGDSLIAKLLKPEILIDCTRVHCGVKTMDLDWRSFSCVIRIGFRYQVGTDGHYVIGDTQQYLGVVFNNRHQIGHEYPDSDNVLKSPLEGVFQTDKRIGDEVQEREKIGMINDINILAPNTGYLTGLLHSGHFVLSGQPLFELISYQKTRETLNLLPANCRSIAGGILEAVLRFLSAIS